MISIQHNKLEIIARKHWEAVDLYLIKQKEKESLDKELISIFENVNNKSYGLKEIILAKPKELEEVKLHYDKLVTNQLINKIEDNYLTKVYTYFSNPKGLNKNEISANKLIDDLGLSICPYCNINAIYNLEEGKRTSEIDHFYNKEKYPFLAMSFYNLIPSCKVCNKIKMAQDKKIINPYDDRYDLTEQVKFKLTINKPSFYYDVNSFDIALQTNNNAINDEISNIKGDIFQLTERYKYHKDIVMEIIQKEYTYNDSYIDELFHQYEGTLFKNREDVIKHVLGTYIETENLHKRPLSKLTHDIAQELGLIP